jgi:CHAD domain-containing protein
MKRAELQFKAGEALPDALRRLSSIQRREAALRSRKLIRSDEAIHQVRLATKFLRALLKLSRSALGERFYQRENSRLRKAASLLSPWRDETVIQHTLEKFSKKAGRYHRDVITAVLLEKQSAQKRPKSELRRALQRAVASLRELEKKLRAPSRTPYCWEAVETGLNKSYRQASHCSKQIRPSDSDEAFHRCRKTTKRLFYQIQMVKPGWPHRLCRLEEQLRELQNLLGKDHDIAVVLHELKASRAGTNKARGALMKLLRRKSHHMRKDIHRMAKRAFHAKPGTFSEKMIRHFRNWRQES